MYQDSETEFSRRYLKEILGALPQPFCLLGGWAVHLTLNDAFKKATGREYPGSRDIDLGFHLDPQWKRKEFKASSFGMAIAKIQSMGFEPESFRFVKRYHRSEKRELTPQEKRRLPKYETFDLYVDFLVDSDDPKRFKVAGFSVMDEPLLARVFSGSDGVTTKMEGISISMPSPRLLMEIKAGSLPRRTPDDKRTKDLIDICGLLLYSGVDPPVLPKAFLRKYVQAITSTKGEEWNRVATALDVTTAMAKRTARLIR
ncbi:MAG: hypothetical protein OK441_04620 [Thaumarchaeota archaeon]|nr:hypothetical protein [Nitrososphaerota archaeon]